MHLDLAIVSLIMKPVGGGAGARLSAHAPDKVVRPALFVVLLTSGLKLVQVI
jgi:uncharacterized membrane protein YfcA